MPTQPTHSVVALPLAPSVRRALLCAGLSSVMDVRGLTEAQLMQGGLPKPWVPAGMRHCRAKAAPAAEVSWCPPGASQVRQPGRKTLHPSTRQQARPFQSNKAPLPIMMAVLKGKKLSHCCCSFVVLQQLVCPRT